MTSTDPARAGADPPRKGPRCVTLTDIRIADEEGEATLEFEVGNSEERYRIGRLLGAGGMGEVFEAIDRLFDRQVAVKYVKTGAAHAQFLREAKTAGQLTHPNIPPIYDVGVDKTGRPYYAMQLIRGRNLAEVLDEHRSEPDRWGRTRLLTMFRQVCAAIEYAHGRGLVHLDVKPANIMVGELEQLYVVDWGLVSPDGGARSGIRGTPAYMSPEQARGVELTSASDVFSLGAVLYEICTGQQAFGGASPSEVRQRVRNADLLDDDRWHQVPPELQEIVVGALIVEPSERPSASDLADQIQAALDGSRERARRRERAQVALKSAREQLRLRQQLQEESRERAALADELKPDPWLPFEERARMWEARDASKQAEVQADLALESAMGDMLEAYRLARDDAGVLEEVGDLYWERMCEAEVAGDRFQVEFFRSQLRNQGFEEYQRRLTSGVVLRFAGLPSEATVKLKRLEDAGPQLLPVEEWSLAVDDGGCSLEVVAGSYVLDVVADGFRDAVVPVLVVRGREQKVMVRLRTEVEIGAGFVHVPADEFIMGGDKETLQSVERQVVFVDDFCIARYPVTWEQFAEFLQFRLDQGVDVEPLLPAIKVAGGGRTWSVENGEVSFGTERAEERRQWPIFNVTYEQIMEYCRWRSEQDGRQYDLPTDAEWEKAARGVDGRWFPWGNDFDPALCCNQGSAEGKAQPQSIGAFPTDVSIYGCRDMAGGVRDWCSSWLGEPEANLRVARGGSWNFGDVGCHCAYRLGCTPEYSYPYAGFRLVHRFE